VAGLAQARPYARRLNVVDAPGGLTVVDDCYNANPASMNAALDTLAGLTASGGRAIAVLGDMLELGPGELEEHAQLGARVAAGDVARVAFFGPRSAEGLRAAAASLGERAAHFTEVEPLVAWLKPQLREGDVVLVKASRGMRLERVVAALTGQPLAGGGH
jgi:UDP-N-acetylmuramoyl-tripeptide--D-alanyl-D-alanine ligase